MNKFHNLLIIASMNEELIDYEKMQNIANKIFYEWEIDECYDKKSQVLYIVLLMN